MGRMTKFMTTEAALVDVPMGDYYDAFLLGNFRSLPAATKRSLDKDQVRTALEFEEKARMLLFYKTTHAFLHPQKKQDGKLTTTFWEVRFPPAFGKWKSGPQMKSPSAAMYANWKFNRFAPGFVARAMGGTMGQGAGDLATLT